ncbi:lysosome membrane protein 2-like isoform X1 [Bombyx mandarina]|uniref:Scavenger receptor class B member 1 n=2 Tax=Bombyx mandarina TaxID=7092 RepID=A0A6J2KCA8_BOMMA|nr:lysosome membrane protein 2-like isoform X1 [Bombyx mandarina]
MENLNGDKNTAVPMITKDVEKVSTPAPGVGKVLIREDTVLTVPGCTSCGRGQFTCSGVQKQWSALCWGQQSDKKYYTLLVVLSTTFVLSLIGTIFSCFTNTINDAILSNMIIRNNSMAFSLWEHPTVEPLMKVYLFNYTNWERVRDGDEKKLHVEEVGPYVYSQELDRVNVEFDGDQLSFQELNNFRYIPEKTNGAYYDQVFVPNLPLLGVVSMSVGMNLSPFAQMSLNSAFDWANHPDPFAKLPVHRFLWGYDDSIINIAIPFLSFINQWKFKEFGLLAGKNRTLSDRYTINTGEKNIDRMNIIEKFDGRDHLTYWGSPECNSLEATDGSIFPPSQLDKNKTLYVFYPQLCRRLPFRFEKEVETYGVKLLRYKMPVNVFDDAKHNPANQCYCEIDTATCPPKGVINVTDCTMGAPALVSFPHFNLGDPFLLDRISGLHPDPLKHISYLDIHPTLGIALKGKSSLQLNIQVRKTNYFSNLHFLDQGLILPIAWIEMGVDELPESLQALVYHGTFSTAAAQLGLSVICILTLIISSLCLCLTIVGRRKKPCVTLKKTPAEITKNQDSS